MHEKFGKNKKNKVKFSNIFNATANNEYDKMYLINYKIELKVYMAVNAEKRENNIMVRNGRLNSQ